MNLSKIKQLVCQLLKVCVLVAQSLSNSLQLHGLLPTWLPVNGILQARIQECIPLSRGSFQPRD